jgi:RHS repeat-associated protein
MQVWDVRGRLASTTDVQGGTTKQALYGYDPDGIRLREQVTTTTGGMSTTDVRLLVVDHQSPPGYAEVIEERTESGLIVASYVYGAGLDPISVFRVGQPVGLYVPDGHSGVRQVVDLAVVAAVLSALRYDAFGNRVATAGTFSDVIGYRGERLDPVLAQYYLRARFYDPSAGRFTQRDPFFGNTQDPQSLHKYLYAYHDPVNRIDPSGNIPVVGRWLGTRVHTFLQRQFEAGAPLTRWGGREIRTIVGDITGIYPPRVAPNTRRPDLAEQVGTRGDIYEIKHADFFNAVHLLASLTLANSEVNNYYLPVIRPLLPLMVWGPGTSWNPGIVVWHQFPSPFPGLVLTTFSDYLAYPGAIVYDFVPTPQAVLLTAAALAVYLNRAMIAQALRLAWRWAIAGQQAGRIRWATASLNVGFIGLGALAFASS